MYRKQAQDIAKPLHFHEWEKSFIPFERFHCKKKKNEPINTAQNQLFEKGPCFSA